MYLVLTHPYTHSAKGKKVLVFKKHLVGVLTSPSQAVEIHLKKQKATKKDFRTLD